MEKKALVYGIRLFNSDELDEIPEAYVMTKDGETKTITLHLIEGTMEECRSQLMQSLDAFFELQN